MTGSIPRLLGAATVGAGVAAAGYVGLVTGACPLDLGVDFRLLRGPVPHVVEAFVLSEQAGGPGRGWPTTGRSNGRVPGPARAASAASVATPHDQVVASHPQAMVPSSRKARPPNTCVSASPSRSPSTSRTMISGSVDDLP